MAYAAGYWAEIVRSLSGSSVVEDVNGSNLWLVTSDGNPLEQEISIGGRWLPISSDENEPDYLAPIHTVNPYRFRKAGEAWLPSAAGLSLNSLSWGGKSRYRFFEVATSLNAFINNKRAGGAIINNKEVAGGYMGGKRAI